MGLLLLIQAISEIIKRLAITRGLIADVHAAGGHQAAAEAEAARIVAVAQEEAAKVEAARMEALARGPSGRPPAKP